MVFYLKNRFLKGISVAAALSLLLTGCGSAGDILEDIVSEMDGYTSTGTHAPLIDEGELDDSKGFMSGRGTMMSMEDGKLNISRLSRDKETSMGGDDWTILVYLCGTDLESRGNAGTSDIIEAIKSQYNERVNIVYQTGGTNGWYDDIIASDRIQRYERVDGDIRLVDEQPLANMGDPDTLSSFIEWGAENYPAENMGLIFWNHGGGSISGICFDELNDMDSLSLKEVDKALSDSFDCMSEKFEFIGFDACLMATLETANVLVPYANYMYGSEETEPGGGWNYTALLDYIAKNPATDGATLGKELCESYYDHCAEYKRESDCTLSVIDLSKIDALITSFNDTAKQMYECEDFSGLVKSILQADNFGGNNRSEGFTNMVDLGGILSGASAYCPNAADTLQKLDDSIIYNKNGYKHSEATGLSMYYPLGVQGSRELSIFADICPSTYYLAFVDKAAYGTTGMDVGEYDNSSWLADFADIWNIGFSCEDYSCNTDTFESAADSSTIPVANVFFDEDGAYTVQLSDFSDLYYAACSLFLWNEDGSTIYLGSDDDVIYDDSGLITDNFDGTWVSLDDGQLLPIEIVDQTEDYSVYTCSVVHNGELTNLRIEYDWNKESWNVLGTWAGIDENGMAGRDVVALADGDIIQPVYTYTSGDTEEYYCGGEYTVNGGIELSYQSLPAADYIYSIALYDIYGNWYFTPSVTFTVDEEGELWFYPEELEGGSEEEHEDLFGGEGWDWDSFGFSDEYSDDGYFVDGWDDGFFNC